MLDVNGFRNIGKIGKFKHAQKKAEKKINVVGPAYEKNVKKVSHQIKIHKGIRRMDLVRKSELSTFCVDKCIKQLLADKLIHRKKIGENGGNDVCEYWWVGG